MFLVVLILVFALIVYFKLYGRHVKDFPLHPGKLPIIGHAHLLLRGGIYLYNVMMKINADLLKQGGRTSVQLGLETFYFFSDPEDCVILMNSFHSKKHWFYSLSKPWLGEGLVTASTSTWAQTHKLLYPMFSSKLIHGYLPVFNKHARRLVDIFAANEGKGAFDHEPIVMTVGLGIICETVFGDEISNNTAQEYNKAIFGLVNICAERINAPWFCMDFIFQLLSPLKRKQDEYLNTINQFSDKYIEKRRAEINNNTKAHEHSGDSRPFADLIIKVADSNNFTYEHLRHEISTLLFAGYENSSITMVYTMMLLGQHSDVQNKAYEELKEVFGDSDRDVEKSDLSKLVYIDAVLKESLRYMPMTLMLARINTVDIKLKKFTIPANSNIIISLYSLLRHPAWGPDADQFVPERWLDPATLPANANNLFSIFGLGKRNCIGKEFALISMKTILVHLLRRYNLLRYE